jgi:hypothetical protein
MKKKSYKLQNTNYKQTANYKLQITRKKAHELHELTRISEKKRGKYNDNQRQSWFASRYFYAANHDCLNQKFLRGGPGGAVFSKSAPPGRRRQK